MGGWAKCRVAAAARGLPFSHPPTAATTTTLSSGLKRPEVMAVAGVGSGEVEIAGGHPIFTHPATTTPSFRPRLVTAVVMMGVCENGTPPAPPLLCVLPTYLLTT